MAVPTSTSAAPSPPARPSSDSPWFWAYLFGAGALAALLLAGPKYQVRQAHIEREYQGRSRAAQNLNGQPPSLTMSTPGDPLIGLRPLVLLLAATTAGAWAVWWNARRASQSGTPQAEKSSAGSAGAEKSSAGAAP